MVRTARSGGFRLRAWPWRAAVPGGPSRRFRMFSTVSPHVLGGVRGGEGLGVREWGWCRGSRWGDRGARCLFCARPEPEGVATVSLVPRRQGGGEAQAALRRVRRAVRV
jgi:hypothetical protein